MQFSLNAGISVKNVHYLKGLQTSFESPECRYLAQMTKMDLFACNKSFCKVISASKIDFNDLFLSLAYSGHYIPFCTEVLLSRRMMSLRFGSGLCRQNFGWKSSRRELHLHQGFLLSLAVLSLTGPRERNQILRKKSSEFMVNF